MGKKSRAIPEFASYFRHMTRRLDIIVSTGEIVIRSSAKGTGKAGHRWKREDLYER